MFCFLLFFLFFEIEILLFDYSCLSVSCIWVHSWNPGIFPFFYVFSFLFVLGRYLLDHFNISLIQLIDKSLDCFPSKFEKQNQVGLNLLWFQIGPHSPLHCWMWARSHHPGSMCVSCLYIHSMEATLCCHWPKWHTLLGCFMNS